jgi:hypothetical protein
VDASQAEEMARPRTELEQAAVAIKDMDARVTQLAEENAELAERVLQLSRLNGELTQQLAGQTALRELVETQLRRQVEPELTEAAVMRSELSVVLKALQMVQEELQNAHLALSAASRTG